MNALIIGRNGQVAWELQRTCPRHITAFAYGRNEIDITDSQSIERVIKELAPNVIINASAYTAVDKAEADQENAYLINATAVELIAKAARDLEIRLLQISTDFVFDGTKNKPYAIGDQANPINVYGASKLAGEKAISKYCPENSAIVRTSWVYSEHGNNFVKTMLRLMSGKEQLKVVSDQIGCPTNANGLAKYLWQLAEIEIVKPVYHYSDLGVASWYDFAVAIQTLAYEYGLLEKTIPILPISSQSYPTAAARPVFSLLEQNDDHKSIHWRANLATAIERICRR